MSRPTQTLKGTLVDIHEQIRLSSNYPDFGAEEEFVGYALENQQEHSETLFVEMMLPPANKSISTEWEIRRVLFPVSIINVSNTYSKDTDADQERLVPAYVPNKTDHANYE